MAPQCPQGKVPTWPPRRVRPAGPGLASLLLPHFAQLHWPSGSSNSPCAFPPQDFCTCYLLCPQHPFTYSAWLTPIHLSGLDINVTSSAKASFPALRPEIRLLNALIGPCPFPSCRMWSGLSLDLYLWDFSIRSLIVSSTGTGT